VSLLTVNEVGRESGAVTILEGVTVRGAAGERIGLVGPNGAGKTTLLRMMLGRAIDGYTIRTIPVRLRTHRNAAETLEQGQTYTAR